MTTETNPITWLIAAAMALGLGSTYLLDGPDDIDSARIEAKSLQDAKRTVAKNSARERVVAKFCAEQGAVQGWTEDGQLTCTR